MKTQIILALTATAAAQTVGPWGQCGGNGYTGATECQEGWDCFYQNDWYSQCLEGTTDGTTTTSEEPPTTITTTISEEPTSEEPTSTTTTPEEPTPTGATCSSTFNKVSASEYVAQINPGWNLGNTLDAIPDEGSWNNAPAQASTFASVKAAGFKGVRIPVTYAYHFDTEEPDYIVNAAWLDRVEEVIDMALDAGLWVLTNVHHDSWIWADVTAGVDQDVVKEKFYRTWLQIGEKLACKDERVGFESINEPPANTEEDASFINELNAIFLQALEETGGHNIDRVVTLVGPVMDPTKTSQWFAPPAEVNNPWALQYHFYSPYDFIFSAWGKTTWGSADEITSLEAELSLVPGNFSDVPLVLGEFDASQIQIEPAARWKWFDIVTKKAAESNTAIMLWDNGLDNFNRDTGVWRDYPTVEIMVGSVEGTNSSLPVATTDGAATEQDSSAYVWHQVGSEVAAYSLSFELNGNALVSIVCSTGVTLTEGTDYTTIDSGATIVLTSSFLSAYLSSSASAATGIQETLTLTFTSGAHPTVEIVVWDVPTFASTTASAATVAGADLLLDVEFKGIKKIAAAKLEFEDGTIMFDDWTQWLGPLQQGRGTWDGQFFSDGEAGTVTVRQAVVDAVIAAGQGGVVTFEFWPRVEGNSVVYTLTV